MLVQVLVKQLTMRGFLVGAHSSKRPEFLKDMTGWIKEGKIEVLEHHTDGLDNIIKVQSRAVAARCLLLLLSPLTDSASRLQAFVGMMK